MIHVQRKKKPSSRSRGPGVQTAPARTAVEGTQKPAGGFAAAGPALRLGGAVQAKVNVGHPDDAFEREANTVADRVVTGRAAPSISRVPASGLQRMEEEEAQTLQRAEEEEEAQTLQRAEEEEQARTLQRAEEEEEAQTLQRAEEEDEAQMLQRAEEEDEAQTLQRADEEEEAQMLQRAEEEEEAQTLQRTEEEEEAQTLQRAEEEDEAQTLQQADEEEEAQTLQAKSVGVPRVTPELEHELRVSKGSGEPLPEALRGVFEDSLGHDLGQVRLHNDARAAAMSRQLNAQAFTHGRDIYFSPGKYEPHSQGGRRLMGHELTHVVQQGKAPPAARASGSVQRRAATVVQRQEGAASDEPPTLAEKMAALVKARQAELLARQEKEKGEGDTAKSKQEEAVEAEKQKAAEAAAEQAEGATEETPAEEKAEGEAPAEAAAAKKPGKAARGLGGPIPASPEDRSPASPEEDPGFVKVVGTVAKVGAEQRDHEPAKDKADQAQKAAESPESEIEATAQSTQVDTMEEAEEPAFDAAAFKAQLLERIKDMAPSTAEEADEFKENDELAGVKSDMEGQVANEREAAAGPTAEATAAPPDTASVERRETTPVPPADAGPAPAEVGAARAAPPPRRESEVEAPLAEETARVDDRMAEEGVNEEQLARANEPEFQGALDARGEARTQAQEAPGTYRAYEGERLAQAQSEATTAAQERTQAMHAERASQLTQVEGRQGETRGRDEGKRAEIAAKINGIYAQTKTNVETILSGLDGEVETAFDEGATAAKQVFEAYVAAKMDAWKERRYGGWLGWARWVKDKVASLPDEVNAFYTQGRNLFIKEMDAVIDNVVATIGKRLTEAKAEIKKGKKEIRDFVAQLPADLQKIGQEEADNIQSQFDALESSVEDKQGELIDTLANKYQENLQAVDARIEEMKEANKGLVEKAVDLVEGVVETIKKLKALLDRVLAKVADVVGLILDDPIGFLGNLISGLKQGFQRFTDNILTHLQTAFITWLTGALGPAGIQVPDDIFSLKGIFSLVMQILGLTWENIRKRAVKKLGEPVVKALETGFEIFKILITQGPAGLWEYVKEQFSNLKEMVLDAIKDMLITQVIKAGIKWILGLLSPVGAFIKAAMAIYEIVMFFVEKAQQILQLIEAIVDSVGAIARGSLGQAAQMVENALARALPMVIGFLASLLGLGGLGKKVQKIIQRVRKPINRAIDKILVKAKKAGQKLLRGKKKEGGKKTVAPANHKALAREIRNKLSSPFKAKTTRAAIAEKKKQAVALETSFQKKVTKGHKVRIRVDESESQLEKDGDIDFKVEIRSNGVDDEGEARAENAGEVHPSLQRAREELEKLRQIQIPDTVWEHCDEDPEFASDFEKADNARWNKIRVAESGGHSLTAGHSDRSVVASPEHIARWNKVAKEFQEAQVQLEAMITRHNKWLRKQRKRRRKNRRQQD